MADVNIQLGHKNAAWFTANASVVLLDGQIVYLNDQSGQYKLGNGVTALSALSFLGGGGGGTQNLDQVLTEGNATGGNNIVVTNGDLIKSTDNKSGLAIGTNGYAELSSSNFDGAESYCYLDAATAALYSQGVNGVSTDNNYMLLTHSTDLRIISPIVRLNGVNLQTTLDGKVDENTAITGATKTKITYDAKGLVTSGTDATTADINSSTNRNYVTDAQLVVIGNTSGTNTGDNATNTTSNAYADGKVENNLTASTTVAPSKTAVNTALDAKYNHINFQCLAVNPTDNQNLYLNGNAIAPQTTDTQRAFTFGKVVTIVECYWAIQQSANGDNAQVDVYLRNITTNTNSLLGSFTSDWGAATGKGFVFSGLSIVTSATDYYTIYIDCPTWATSNPTAWLINGNLSYR